MRKLETTACKAGCRWTSECGCTGMSLLDFKQPASERGTFKETLLAVIMKLCLDVHCDGLPISSKWAETMSASKVENQFNNLMFKRWLERMESVHVLQYAVSTKSGTFWSTVEMHILCSCGSRGWAQPASSAVTEERSMTGGHCWRWWW